MCTQETRTYACGHQVQLPIKRCIQAARRRQPPDQCADGITQVVQDDILELIRQGKFTKCGDCDMEDINNEREWKESSVGSKPRVQIKSAREYHDASSLDVDVDIDTNYEGEESGDVSRYDRPIQLGRVVGQPEAVEKEIGSSGRQRIRV